MQPKLYQPTLSEVYDLEITITDPVFNLRLGQKAEVITDEIPGIGALIAVTYEGRRMLALHQGHSIELSDGRNVLKVAAQILGVVKLVFSLLLAAVT